jgi:hypothetical protein
VLAIASSRSRTFLKDCFGETPKPARATRALPGPMLRQQGGSFPKFLQVGNWCSCSYNRIECQS